MVVWQSALEKLDVMPNSVCPSPGFWANKRVLVTGHSGFKGSWLTLWLQSLGASVTGLSLAPNTNPNLFSLAKIDQVCNSQFCDIRDLSALNNAIKLAKPEIFFHLAAQPLVRISYQDPIDTLLTNVMGTANILETIRLSINTRVAVMITTDKVYRNHELPIPYREDDPLGGYDPYSASKAASEMIISSYRDSFLLKHGVAVASARAGNVIGGGDWSKDRLMPDAIRAWQQGVHLEIRRPDAIRPWQHVLEPLAGYLTLAQKLWEHPHLAGAYNFGPEVDQAATVRSVIELARATFGKGDVRYAQDIEGLHEAGLLTLAITKAKEILEVKPRLSLDQAVRLTTDWYRDQQSGVSALDLCKYQIKIYEGML